jgi:hypothetical protein
MAYPAPWRVRAGRAGRWALVAASAALLFAGVLL